MMINSNLKARQLKAKIARLEAEKAQLQAGLYEIINLAYQAVNKDYQKHPQTEETNNSSAPEPNFFNLFGNLKCSACKSKNKPPTNEHLRECAWSFFNSWQTCERSKDE